MTLIDNRRWLNQHFRPIAERVKSLVEQPISKEIIVESSKSGLPTLQINDKGKMKYVHSKYDPLRDNARILKDYEGNVPVLFFGVGLGYHIEAFIQQFPSVRFALYEPNEEVFLKFLERVDLTKWNHHNILSLIVGKDLELENEISRLLQQTNGKMTIISLPLYDQIYRSEKDLVMNTILNKLKSTKSSIITEVAFQKLWTTNAIKNAPTVLRTPNMLVDVDKEAFRDKPAIIVAAGPSLNEELENLRQIKEEGRAYLFSVGSAINTLIANDIVPDAICSYDPQAHNERVIKIIREQNIPEVPLIFGSSVGYETLEHYPNQMYHMITSQDTIVSSLVSEGYSTVNDAPSIAVVTYQLLYELGCSPIILVGQNLGYRDGHRYAKGIDYGNGTEITENQKKSMLYTKDVEGNLLATNEGFNSMREQLELYIAQGKRQTFNTTVQGAHIEGTTYKRLSQLLESELSIKGIIEDWSCYEPSYDRKQIYQSLKQLALERKENVKNIKNAFRRLERLYDQLKLRKFQTMENSYGKFDEAISTLQDNKFYIHYVEPMIRVQFESLRQTIEDVRYETNQMRKGEVIIPAFNDFLVAVREHSQYASELFEEMKEKIEEMEA